MPTLEDLPRELRHQMFYYAFDQAAADDIKLHNNIHSCLWYNERNRSRLIGSYQMPGSLEQALQHDEVDEEYEDEELSLSSKEMTYLPNLNDLAVNLCLVFPDLRDDVVFVLEKTMKKTCPQDSSITIERRETEGYYCDAVAVCGRRAERKWCSYDDGIDVVIPARGDYNSFEWATPEELRKETELRRHGFHYDRDETDPR